jgi:hypothetical protein
MRKNNFYKKTKKKSFLLLEVLIAISILAMSIPFLIHNPIFFYKKELKTLEDLELKQIEIKAFTEIRNMLFKNEISWNLFSSKKHEEGYISEEPLFFYLPKELSGKKVYVNYRIWTKRENSSPKSTIRKIAIQIAVNKTIEPETKVEDLPVYNLFVRKIPLTSQTPKV